MLIFQLHIKPSCRWGVGLCSTRSFREPGWLGLPRKTSVYKSNHRWRKKETWKIFFFSLKMSGKMALRLELGLTVVEKKMPRWNWQLLSFCPFILHYLESWSVRLGKGLYINWFPYSHVVEFQNPGLEALRCTDMLLPCGAHFCESSPGFSLFAGFKSQFYHLGVE